MEGQACVVRIADLEATDRRGMAHESEVLTLVRKTGVRGTFAHLLPPSEALGKKREAGILKGEELP